MSTTDQKTGPLAVIPARMGAQRFPGKPLARIDGKPMVQHVYDRCVESRAFGEVVVATDSEEIAAAVKAFGGKAALTSASHESGTARIAEAARQSAAKWVINVQGDEPAIHPDSLRALAAALDRPGLEMATLIRPLAEDERANPNVVKVVLDRDGFALYFSRADIPHARADVGIERWAHLGVYAYRADVLQRVGGELQPTALARTESLEQLTALYNGIRIFCARTPHPSVGVDRPEDVAAAEALLKSLP